VKMAEGKHKHEHGENCNHEHDDDDMNRKEVVTRIKALETKERVKAAALNFYLEKKKDLD